MDQNLILAFIIPVFHKLSPFISLVWKRRVEVHVSKFVMLGVLYLQHSLPAVFALRSYLNLDSLAIQVFSGVHRRWFRASTVDREYRHCTNVKV